MWRRQIVNGLDIKLIGLAALAVLVLAAGCVSGPDDPTPTAEPTATQETVRLSPLASCGGPIEHAGSDALTAIYPQSDGYLWALPDGTDANVSFADILAADPESSDSASLSMPIWGSPAVSPDHRRSAIVVMRRLFGSSPDTDPIVVLSSGEEAVTGIFELQVENPNPLVRMSWLSRSGCLAVLAFSPGVEQGLVILRPDGTVAAEFRPKLARGEVMETPDGDWIVLDRTGWVDGPEIELFSVHNPGSAVIVPRDETVPDFLGLAPDGQTAAEFAAELREQRTTSG